MILNFLVGCETLIWALLILRSSYCSSILTISIAYKVLMITGAKFTWFYGALWFCGFNKWNFETSKSTFDIQFIIFRFWNEGLGERSSSSFTYVLSLQLDSHGFFVGFFAISQFKNFALKPEKFILTMNYSRRTKSSDDFAICESVWCLVCSAHDKNNKI